MPLEYTSLPPVPRGMNLAGPSLFIDDAYCKWMQDVLVDRPGQIRMRGPLIRWIDDTTVDDGEQILGACETITPDGNWRTAVFFTGSSGTDGSFPGVNGKVRVYTSTKTNVAGGTAFITLPFELRTKWNPTTKHWENNTIIDAKPALGGGTWIGVTDGYGVLDAGVQALMFWRGAGKQTHTEYERTYTQDSKDINVVAPNNIESGMFVFDVTADADGNGRYLGVVATKNDSVVSLEKEVLITTYNATTPTSYSPRTLEFRSFRGFVHQQGRGLGTTDNGNYITTGRLGSDAEGFFKAGRVTIGKSGDHRNFAYRSSDHQYVGTIVRHGTVSNTQVEISAPATREQDYLADDNYFIIRDDANLKQASDTTNNTRKYSMLASERVHDSRPFLSPGDDTTSYVPFPGVFNSTYANRQWFASVGNTAIASDKFVNRVVFSSRDNPENINLAPDASDSIIIPGREAIRGIAGSVSGLLVFVENKTYIIKGTNRATFALEELYPDGTLSTNSIVQVGGGVIWAGKQGIYYYDGVTVRNFTNQTLGIYYTDGVHQFDSNKDRIYAFVFNNYLVINFTNWDSSYALSRWQATSQEDQGNQDPPILITLGNSENYTRLTPNSITFSIFLPTGAIGTLSNFTPRGFVTTSSLANTKGLIMMNLLDTIDINGNPTGNRGQIMDLSTIFTEEIDTVLLDACISNDANRSAIIEKTIDGVEVEVGNISKAGPDFYLESKQYNFGESTLKKWWRKMLFNLRINNGYMMVEFVDINDTSLVSPVTGENVVRNDDETGYFLIPTTTLPWGFYDEDDNRFTGNPTWAEIQASGETWGEYFGNQTVRYSRWLGIRQNSLGFKFYSLHGFQENGAETLPELVAINDWVFGLKPLRKGRN